MGLRVLDRLDFRRAAHPLLRDLNLRTKETVHMAILQETRAISIEKFDSPQPVGLGRPPGRGDAAPLHGCGQDVAGLPGRGTAESDCPVAGTHAHDRAHHYGVAAIAQGVGANPRAGLRARPGRSGGRITLRGGAGLQPHGANRGGLQRGGAGDALDPGAHPRNRPNGARDQPADFLPARLSRRPAAPGRKCGRQPAGGAERTPRPAPGNPG